MTVSPAPRETMCSGSNVIITSIKVRSSSCSELGKETPKNRHASFFDSDMDVTMTSELSRTSPELVTTTRLVRGSSEDCEEGLRLTSVSETVPNSPRAVSFEDEVFDVNGANKVWAIPPATGNASVDECTKMVYQLSRELAVLDALCLGLGGDTDSDRLREELRLSRIRACSLSHQNASALVPLLRSKSSLKTEETAEVDRLYRIYSGCLEYLVYLLFKLRSLLCLFHLHNDTCCLIQTGLSDPLSFVHKGSNVQKDGSPAHIGGEGSSHNGVQPSHAHDDPTRLARVIQTTQQLLCAVTNASDIQPWDVMEEGLDIPKFNSNTSDGTKRTALRTVTFNDGIRRQRVTCTLAVVVIIGLLVAVVLIASLLTSS